MAEIPAIRTLLVQRDVPGRRMLLRVLAGRGHRVLVVDDAVAGCAALAAEPFALVLVDVDVPEGDAPGLCRRLRSAPGGRRPVLVALAERAQPRQIAELLDAGADDHLGVETGEVRLESRLAVVERRAAAAAGPARSHPHQACGSLVCNVPCGAFASSLNGPVEDDAGPRRARGGPREKDARFCAVFESVAMGIVVADLGGRILQSNETMARMLGYTAEELVGTSVADLTHPDDWDGEVQRFRRLKGEGRGTLQMEKRYLHRDGGVVWGRLSASLIGEAPGTSQLVVCVVENITRRKQAEDDLRRSEHRYRLIADNATDMIWTATAEGLDRLPERLAAAGPDQVAGELMAHLRLTYVSPSIERLLGYTVEEGMALGPKEMLTAESYQAATSLLGEELAVEARDPGHAYRQRVLEIQEVAKDGSVRWCEMTATFLRDESGRISGMVGVTRDITQRREAERALRESEATLRGLVENMPDFVIVVDTAARIQFANRGVGNASMEDLLGREGFGFLKPPHRQACREAFARALRTGETQTVECLDVFDLWWSCRVVPLWGEGNVSGAMIICTDVTQRRSSEAAVQREQDLLRQLLELHERDRKLLAFELHDGFAQQLTGAMLNLEAAAQLQAADPELARQSFQTGIRLLRESIDESRRLVSGLRPPVLDEFGIVPAIEHLVDESRGRGGPEIRFVSRGPFRRLARPLESAVFRIVQETLSNARRHSQSRRVEVELSRQGEHVCVSVRDWGVGFDPGQIDESHFGLRGIRERTRLLGGEATIDTAPGKGTWVRVRLPVVERAPAKAAQAAPAAGPGTHGAEIIPEPEG